MTRAEYLQLVEQAASFKQLDEKTKSLIRKASGAEMESYATAFREEAELVKEAYQRLEKETEQVVIVAQGLVMRAKQASLAKVEKSQRGEELSGAEELLKDL